MRPASPSGSAKNAATSTTAMPHDSDDSVNSTGTNGDLHNATAPSPCSSRPVYTMTTKPTATATASTATAAARGTDGRYASRTSRQERPARGQHGQGEGADGQIRRRRPQEQVEHPVDAPQIEQQAQHAQRERGEAGKQRESRHPLARRRLVHGHAGIRPEGRTHEGQVEPGRDHDRPGPGTAEEQVAHRQRSEHIPSPHRSRRTLR